MPKNKGSKMTKSVDNDKRTYSVEEYLESLSSVDEISGSCSDDLTVIVTDKNILISNGGDKNIYPINKGFERLAWLLANPDSEIHCTTLVAEDPGFYWDKIQIMKNSTPTFKHIKKGENFCDMDDSGDNAIIDMDYVNQLKKEISKAIDELAVAGEYNDLAVTEEKKAKLQVLKDTLLQNIRPDGSHRNFAHEFKNIKDSIRKSLDIAVNRIGKHNPKLKQHLIENIRVGTCCCYHSQPSLDVRVIYNRNKATNRGVSISKYI